MGYIREPKGVDFLIAPTIITEDDKWAIKAAIANYKRIELTSANQEAISHHSVQSNVKTISHKHKKLA